MKIVIVDDEPVWRALARAVAIRSGNGEIAGEAADGSTAIGLILSMRPAIALLALQLPNLNAFDIIESVRKLTQPGSYRPRYLVITTHINPYTVWRSRRLGVGGLVDKRSCDPAELETALMAVSKGMIYTSETVRQCARKLGAREPSFSARMTERELQVLPYVVDGFDDGEIGDALLVTDEAIKKHVYRMFGKFSVHTRSALARLGKDLGFSRYLALPWTPLGRRSDLAPSFDIPFK